MNDEPMLFEGPCEHARLVDAPPALDPRSAVEIGFPGGGVGTSPWSWLMIRVHKPNSALSRGTS